MINYVCKCDNALCEGKSVNTGLYMYKQVKKNKSTEKVVETNKPINKLTINLENHETQH